MKPPPALGALLKNVEMKTFRNPHTGAKVSYGRNVEGFETGLGAKHDKYMTSCDTHGTYNLTHVLRLAKHDAMYPEFCDKCRDKLIKKGLL